MSLITPAVVLRDPLTHIMADCRCYPVCVYLSTLLFVVITLCVYLSTLLFVVVTLCVYLSTLLFVVVTLCVYLSTLLFVVIFLPVQNKNLKTFCIAAQQRTFQSFPTVISSCMPTAIVL